MHSEQHRERSTPRAKPGPGRRFLTALLTGADTALADAGRDADERADDDDSCRAWPAHSRLTRGYEEL